MKPRGIPIAQIRSDIELDEKLLALRDLALDRTTYFAAFGAWISMVLGAWNKATREVPSIRRRTTPKTLLDLLAEVELLDAEGHIPQGAFDHYVGEVLRYRASEAERKRNVRRTPQDSCAQAPDSAESSSPLLSFPLVENTTGAPAREMVEWVAIAPTIADLTGRVHSNPYSGTASMLVEDAVAFGSERVIEVMRAVAGAMKAKPDLRALAFGVRNALRPPPDGKAVLAADTAAAEKLASDRRYEATQRKITEERERIRAYDERQKGGTG